MRYLWRFLFSLSIFLLASCSSSASAGFPLTVTENSSATASFTPLPSFTPKPKATPTASLTPLPASTNTPLPLASAESTLVSPDKNWIAYFFGLYDAQLAVTNNEKTIVWEVNEGDFEGYEAMFQPYRWSQNSQYLYFNAHLSIDGHVPFSDGMGLRRLDVSNGQVSEILPAHDITNGRWNIVNFSLSPNDKLLAYIDLIETEPQLIIRDLETGSESKLLLKEYTVAGSILWSPNQDRLVLALAKGTDWENTIFTIMEVNIATFQTTTIIQNHKPGLDPVEWVTENEIKIQERGDSQNLMLVNLVTKNIQVVPTTK